MPLNEQQRRAEEFVDRLCKPPRQSEVVEDLTARTPPNLQSKPDEERLVDKVGRKPGPQQGGKVPYRG